MRMLLFRFLSLIISFFFINACNFNGEKTTDYINSKVVNPFDSITGHFDSLVYNEKIDSSYFRMYGFKDSLRIIMEDSAAGGSKQAYDHLVVEYKRSHLRHSFLYASIIRANKFNDKRAHFNVFYCLMPFVGEQSFRDSYNQLDNKTKKMALFYLLKAKELGDEAAADLVEREFKEYINDSSKTYE